MLTILFRGVMMKMIEGGFKNEKWFQIFGTNIVCFIHVYA